MADGLFVRSGLFYVFRLRADGDVQADGCVIYRSGMNPKIHRNFEIFTPCDFIAAITQHPQGWLARRSLGEVGYSNKMRGQRLRLPNGSSSPASMTPSPIIP